MKLSTVLDQAAQGIHLQGAYFLLTQRDPVALEAIRHAADSLRQVQCGDIVTHVINRNINFTNICNQHCSFCAFRRDADQEGAYWLDFETIMAKTTEAVHLGATEICMQGGLNPQAQIEGSSLRYYKKLVQTIKDTFPQLHLHAFSPQEIDFIARLDGLTLETVIRELQAAGVGSMPGTAAEVLYEPVRRRLCPEKLTTNRWIEVVTLAHRLGMPMTCTLMAGHIETLEERVIHLGVLRAIQERALDLGVTGFTEFILLPYVGALAPAALRKKVGRDQPDLNDALLTMAVARLVLGNGIPNHQPSWVKLTLTGATEALRWGCNDLGGTLMEEHITSMAGAQGGTCLTSEQLATAARSLGRISCQRDTLYHLISGCREGVS